MTSTNGTKSEKRGNYISSTCKVQPQKQTRVINWVGLNLEADVKWKHWDCRNWNRSFLSFVFRIQQIRNSQKKYVSQNTEGEIDVIQALHEHKVQMEDISRDNKLHEPQKAQIAAEVWFSRTKEIEEIEDITIYTNSRYIPVEVHGLTNLEFLDAVEQMLKKFISLHPMAVAGKFNSWRSWTSKWSKTVLPGAPFI